MQIKTVKQKAGKHGVILFIDNRFNKYSKDIEIGAQRLRPGRARRNRDRIDAKILCWLQTFFTHFKYS